MLKELKKFYKEHSLLVNLLLIALIVRLIYLNAIAPTLFDEDFYIGGARGILSTGIDPNPEHPPLVKLMLAASIWLFGDHALSWRVPPVLFGLLGIVFFYFIVLELSRNKKLAALSAALLAFDPMHMILSRIAMLDIFMLSFALGGTYFMLRRNYVWAGFLFGLGLASKWPAIFPLFVASAFLWSRKKLGLKDLAYVLLIVGLVYVLVYTPFIVSQGPEWWLSSQTYYIGEMTTMPAASQQSSPPIQWLYLQKPVWFAHDKPGFVAPADMMWLVNIVGGEPALAIVALGNPVFWIPGLLALAWIAFRKSRKLSAVRSFSLLWFAFTYLPFLLIPRTHMAIYYMLLVLPAYALALSQFLVMKRWEKWYLVLYAASVLFLLPLVIGLPISKGYLEFLQPLINTYPIEGIP